MITYVSTTLQIDWLRSSVLISGFLCESQRPLRLGGESSLRKAHRLQEFFDHFLKGAPEPEWMQKGIPYLQREKEKEEYRAADEDPER